MNRLGYLFAIFALPASALACDGLVISHPWIREAPPGVGVLAGYGTLVNTGKKPLTVLTIAGADFESVELHQSQMIDGQMRMRRIDPLTLKAGKSIELSPNSYHLMLINPNRPIVGSSALLLHCADGDLAADFPVKQSSPE